MFPLFEGIFVPSLHLMKGRFSLTSSQSPKKSPSIYKQSQQKRSSPRSSTQKFSNDQKPQIDIPENILERNSPQKSRTTRAGDSQRLRTGGSSDSFMKTKKQNSKSIDELKEEYNEIAQRYNNELQQRDQLTNDISELENMLKETYKEQSQLSHQKKKLEQSKMNNP